MQNITTTCFQRQKSSITNFSGDGSTVISFPSSTVYLETVDREISQGLVKRLVKFAVDEVKEAGLEHVLNWKVHVEFLSSEFDESNGQYTVAFENSRGTKIKLCGILTSKGWPTLHHGFEIET